MFGRLLFDWNQILWVLDLKVAGVMDIAFFGAPDDGIHLLSAPRIEFPLYMK